MNELLAARLFQHW